MHVVPRDTLLLACPVCRNSRPIQTRGDACACACAAVLRIILVRNSVGDERTQAKANMQEFLATYAFEHHAGGRLGREIRVTIIREVCSTLAAHGYQRAAFAAITELAKGHAGRGEVRLYAAISSRVARGRRQWLEFFSEIPRLRVFFCQFARQDWTANVLLDVDESVILGHRSNFGEVLVLAGMTEKTKIHFRTCGARVL